DAEALLRGACGGQPGLEPFDQQRQRVILDQEEQLFLALEVVVETGEADPRRPRDVANGRAMVPPLREHAGGGTQDALELGVVWGAAVRHGWGRSGAKKNAAQPGASGRYRS